MFRASYNWTQDQSIWLLTYISTCSGKDKYLKINCKFHNNVFRTMWKRYDYSSSWLDYFQQVHKFAGHDSGVLYIRTTMMWCCLNISNMSSTTFLFIFTKFTSSLLRSLRAFKHSYTGVLQQAWIIRNKAFVLLCWHECAHVASVRAFHDT